MKALRPGLFFVSLMLIAGLACSFGGGGATPTQQPIEQPVQLVDPTSMPPEPITEEPATEAPPPTEAPSSQSDQPFFTEEFDTPLSSVWTPYLIYDETESEPDKVKVETNDGNLVWDFDSKWVNYYLFYNPFTYEDVQVAVRADNRGKNNTAVSLICHYDPEVGWYQFSVANNGLYAIIYYELLDNGKIQQNRVANGGSKAIKQGKDVNEYSITCRGNQLTLNINGEKVTSVEERKYGLRSGQVGVSVSSLNVLPILVEMDWLKVSEP